MSNKAEAIVKDDAYYAAEAAAYLAFVAAEEVRAAAEDARYAEDAAAFNASISGAGKSAEARQ